jgi:hypothetical protein
LGEATDGLRERRAGHDPGRVQVDVAVAIAAGAVTISDVQMLADQLLRDGSGGRRQAPLPTHARPLGTEQKPFTGRMHP